MCGICGILRFQASTAPPLEGLLDRMTDRLAHRGPDDRGTWSHGDVHLGHRRLAVIDISRAGRQPMASEDASVHIVYNGEVYNFRELSEEHDLRGRGHVFRSRTDTEVVLHLYESLGIRMAEELNGMFAMGIWDTREPALYLIRDRYGIKPLFYQKDRDHFRFASEIKAILEDPRVPRRVNLQAMHDFFTLDYIPGPQTAFEGIFEVPPGHWMKVDVQGNLELHRYWDLPFQVDPSLTGESAVARSMDLLTDSVRRRLVADVPLGVLLSGGMDSSAIVALMHRLGVDPIRTYSVGFLEESFDERAAARSVSRAFCTIHEEVVVTADRVRELLPTCIGFIDEPYGDGSAIPTYCISERAREDVVVLLSGEGGDEAFSGYETHAAYKAARMAGRIPPVLWNRIVAPLVGRLPVSHDKLSLEFRLKRFLGGLNLDPVDAHLWWRIVLTDAQKKSLYAPRVWEALVFQDPARHFREVYGRSNAPDPLGRLLHVDASVFLPDDLMIKNDRMTMAHSLEARVPFTDPDLTEFLSSVPSKVKFPGFRKKHLLRKGLRGTLPREILKKKKFGLELPYSRWLTAELKDLLTDYCDPSRIAEGGLFRPEAVGALVQEHLSFRRDHGRALWGLLSFMVWHEMYFE